MRNLPIRFSAALIIAASACWSQAQFYTQAADNEGAYASQNDGGGFGQFAQAFDNFMLGSSQTIDHVSWTGSYITSSHLNAITGWTVSFYSDSSGAPGGLLSSTHVVGNAGETYLGGDGASNDEYSYGMDVNLFGAAANTEYWLSVVPDLDFLDSDFGSCQWGWETSGTFGQTGDPGDGNSFQNFFGSAAQTSGDLAFSLRVTTPEPFTTSLGIAGVGLFIRRKRKPKSAESGR